MKNKKTFPFFFFLQLKTNIQTNKEKTKKNKIIKAFAASMNAQYRKTRLLKKVMLTGALRG